MNTRSIKPSIFCSLTSYKRSFHQRVMCNSLTCIIQSLVKHARLLLYLSEPVITRCAEHLFNTITSQSSIFSRFLYFCLSPELFNSVNVTPGGIPDVLEPLNHIVLNMKMLRKARVSTQFPNISRLLHMMKTSALSFHQNTQIPLIYIIPPMNSQLVEENSFFLLYSYCRKKCVSADIIICRLHQYQLKTGTQSS